MRDSRRSRARRSITSWRSRGTRPTEGLGPGKPSAGLGPDRPRRLRSSACARSNSSQPAAWVRSSPCTWASPDPAAWVARDQGHPITIARATISRTTLVRDPRRRLWIVRGCTESCTWHASTTETYDNVFINILLIKLTWHQSCLMISETETFLCRFRSLTSSVVIHPALRGIFLSECHPPGCEPSALDLDAKFRWRLYVLLHRAQFHCLHDTVAVALREALGQAQAQHCAGRARLLGIPVPIHG
jgi:hypothetical protein